METLHLTCETPRHFLGSLLAGYSSDHPRVLIALIIESQLIS